MQAQAQTTLFSTVQNKPDVTETFTDGAHSYTVTFNASTRMFASYLDGVLVKEISYNELKSKIEKAQQSALENRAANKCSVGMGVVSIINGALRTAAGIATGGAAVPVAGLVTSLIPTIGGMFC
ncbi:hypothetical protein RQN30_06730 [Arcanobacterium hippocoleae]